jgi:hypothetical protein
MLIELHDNERLSRALGGLPKRLNTRPVSGVLGMGLGLFSTESRMTVEGELGGFFPRYCSTILFTSIGLLYSISLRSMMVCS